MRVLAASADPWGGYGQADADGETVTELPWIASGIAPSSAAIGAPGTGVALGSTAASSTVSASSWLRLSCVSWVSWMSRVSWVPSVSAMSSFSIA